MKREHLVLLLGLAVCVWGCVSIPSANSVREKYRAGVAADEEVKMLVNVRSISALSRQERKKLFDRYERAIDGQLKKAKGRKEGIDTAIDLALILYSLFPDERKACMRLASLYKCKGDMENYEGLLREALRKRDDFFFGQRNRNLALLYNDLALCAINKHHCAEAVNYLRKARNLDPGNVYTAYLLGSCHAQMVREKGGTADAEKGIAYFQEAFSKAPDKATPSDYELYIFLLHTTGKAKQARKIAEEAVRKYPNYPGFNYELARLQEAKGDLIGAYYSYVMEILRTPANNPYRARSRAKAAEIGAKAKKDARLEEIKLVSKAAPLNKPGGDFAEAEKLLRKALELSKTKHFILKIYIAEALVGQKKFDEAVKLYKEALKTDGKFVPALVELAEVYLVMGKESEAQATWDKAVEIDPMNWKVQSAAQRIESVEKSGG